MSTPAEPDRLEVARQIVRAVLSGAQTPTNAPPLFEDDLLYLAVATLRQLDPAWLSEALTQGGPGLTLVAQCLPPDGELPAPRPAPEPRNWIWARGCCELDRVGREEDERFHALVDALTLAVMSGRRAIPIAALLDNVLPLIQEQRPRSLQDLERVLRERGGDPASTPLGRHPGAAEVASLLGDLAWLALRAGCSGRLARLILAYAAERVGVPYPCFDRDDARA
ncbi:MAG TPA: hypothetical protein DEA08_08750, partial [Planctomycetes bacterium]|nr:hypothetical protein [Planctomycetota bacterium]